MGGVEGRKGLPPTNPLAYASGPCLRISARGVSLPVMGPFRELFGIFSRKEPSDSALSLQSVHGGLLIAQEGIEALEASQEAAAQLGADLPPTIQAIHDKLSELDRRLAETRLAVGEGIERVDRAERRIKNTVKRARGQLKELGYTDAGLEAEAAELQLVDDEGSRTEELPAVHDNVEPVEQASSIRGVAASTLARRRGYSV